MRASGTVTRSTLRQQIADALRDEVLAGRLQQGREFTVRQIAEQYGVSATPVREALFDLSAQGLLESDQHRGIRKQPALAWLGQSCHCEDRGHGEDQAERTGTRAAEPYRPHEHQEADHPQ